MSERIASAKIRAEAINKEGKKKPRFSIEELQKNQKEIDCKKKEKLIKEKKKCYYESFKKNNFSNEILTIE